jgi:hypothetical protein
MQSIDQKINIISYALPSNGNGTHKVLQCNPSVLFSNEGRKAPKRFNKVSNNTIETIYKITLKYLPIKDSILLQANCT